MTTNASCCSTRRPAAATPQSAVFCPDVDVHETAADVTLQADLPGASRDSIDVKFDDGILTIKAAVPAAPAHRADSPGLRPLIREYGVGDFQRSFRLATELDPSRISATYAGGVLTVTIPKAQSAQPRKIEIKSA